MEGGGGRWREVADGGGERGESGMETGGRWREVEMARKVKRVNGDIVMWREVEKAPWKKKVE